MGQSSGLGGARKPAPALTPEHVKQPAAGPGQRSGPASRQAAPADLADVQRELREFAMVSESKQSTRTEPGQKSATPRGSSVSRPVRPRAGSASGRSVRSERSARTAPSTRTANSARGSQSGLGRPGSSANLTFRSPIYRSNSPSRRVGNDGVVISNFSRAPRFRDHNPDIPGPGQYPVPHTDFARHAVPEKYDASAARLGHTWRTSERASAEGHAAQMLALTDVQHPDAQLAAIRGSAPNSRSSSRGRGGAGSTIGGGVGGSTSGAGSVREQRLAAEVERLQALRTTDLQQAALAHSQLQQAADRERARADKAHAAMVDMRRKTGRWTDLIGTLQEAVRALSAGVHELNGASQSAAQPVRRAVGTVQQRASVVAEAVQSMASALEGSRKPSQDTSRAASPAAEGRGRSPQRSRNPEQHDNRIGVRGMSSAEINALIKQATEAAAEQKAAESKEAGDGHSRESRPSDAQRRVGPSGTQAGQALPPVDEGTAESMYATLQVVFRMFAVKSSTPGQQLSGLSMDSQHWMRFLRACRALSTKLTFSAADLAFVRAVRDQGTVPPPAVEAALQGQVKGLPLQPWHGKPHGAGGSRRITFAGFLLALAEVSSVRAPALPPADALALFLRRHVLPVAPTVTVVGTGREGMVEEQLDFEEAFMASNSLSWLGRNAEGLESMFHRFATQSGIAEPAMDVDGYLRFAHELGLSTLVDSHDDVHTLWKDANRGILADSDGEELTYPEWLELVAMAAWLLFQPIGAKKDEQHPMPVLLDSLFYSMLQKGGNFLPGPERALLDGVAASVRARAANARR